jgi:predicted  nucleic acid-binding Zn-ribbon protein
MPNDDKMVKCRNCGKEVKKEDTEKDVTHDCGWNEFRARNEVRKNKLMSDILDEFRDEDKKDKEKNAPKKGPFGW